ncbi:MAG: hypothetical protein ACOCP4_03540 [Candidatus Woesearchaeota archaeon]
MRLYHGSPKKFKTLKPKKASGMNDFENMTAIFLTKKFLYASLYAIGKTLKGETPFGVSETKLVILGNLKPKSGYVHEVEVKNPIKGKNSQYAYKKNLNPIKVTKVFPKNYSNHIIFVKSKKELLKELDINLDQR